MNMKNPQISWRNILWPMVCEFSFALKDREFDKARSIGRLLQMVCLNEGQPEGARSKLRNAIHEMFSGIHRGIWL